MRPPKDLDKYIPSWIAGIRLMDLALKYVCCRPPSARIKWSLTLWLYYPPDALKNSKAIAVPTRGTFGSGTYQETGKPRAKEIINGK